MRITVFPSVKPVPANNNEKNAEAPKAINGAIVNITTNEQLVETITSYAWSPSVFKSNKRSNDNFVECDFFVIDIDEGLPIQDCGRILSEKNLCALVLPSPSFTKEVHKYRVIFPLAHTISVKAQFDETWKHVQSILPELDAACKDYARFYFACKLTDDGFFIEGDLLTPVRLPEKPTRMSMKEMNRSVKVTGDIKELVDSIYKKDMQYVPKIVEYFIKNAHTGLEGQWIWTLNGFCFCLALAGIDEQSIEEICQKVAPQQLDNRDLKHIRIGIRDGMKRREEENI